jgi:hypothetical protein
MIETVPQLKAWLVSTNRFTWNDVGNGLHIESPSPDGFSVWITKEEDEWAVGFGDGWHDHLETEAEAVSCCLRAISGQVREVTKFRGTFPCNWSAQLQLNGQWQTISTTGLFLSPFWRRTRIEFRQNPVLDLG